MYDIIELVIHMAYMYERSKYSDIWQCENMIMW